MFLESITNILNRLSRFGEKMVDYVVVEMVLNTLLESYEYYVQLILSQKVILTLVEFIAKLLHEETRSKLYGEKKKDTKTLWVKFCKMSIEKKWLHGGDKHDENKKHNFEKKVVTTCN